MRFGVVVLIGFLLCGDISARTYRELNTPIVTTNSSGNAISSEAMTDKSPEIVYHRNQTVGNNEGLYIVNADNWCSSIVEYK